MTTSQLQTWHVNDDPAAVEVTVRGFCERQRLTMERRGDATWDVGRGSQLVGMLLGKTLEPAGMLPVGGQVRITPEQDGVCVAATFVSESPRAEQSVVGGRVKERYERVIDELISDLGSSLTGALTTA